MASNPAMSMARPADSGEAVDGVGDLFLRDGCRQGVAVLSVIERHLLALGLDSGRSHRRVAKPIALADGAGVHQLRDRERAVRLDPADHRPPRLGLRFVCHPGLMKVALREYLIGVDALGDDGPEAAPREAFVVAGHRLGRAAILRRRDARHRRDGEPVLHLMTVYNDRREKRAGVDVHGQGPPNARIRARLSRSEGYSRLLRSDLAVPGGVEKPGWTISTITNIVRKWTLPM